MEANRDSAPDAIPPEIIAEHVREAQVTVVSSRYLRDLAEPGKARQLIEFISSSKAKALTPLGLCTAAILAIPVWIIIGPESTALFVVASLVVVSALVGLMPHVWRWTVLVAEAGARNSRADPEP